MIRCWYCGQETNKLHKEHQDPKYRGGKDAGNIVLSCPSCNLLKSWRNVEEFRNYIKELPKLLADYSPKFRLLMKFYDVKEKHDIKFYGENNPNHHE